MKRVENVLYPFLLFFSEPFSFSVFFPWGHLVICTSTSLKSKLYNTENALGQNVASTQELPETYGR